MAIRSHLDMLPLPNISLGFADWNRHGLKSLSKLYYFTASAILKLVTQHTYLMSVAANGRERGGSDPRIDKYSNGNLPSGPQTLQCFL
jgi:hypothetical protein